MTITIWHNPNCGTSRKVLAAIQDAGQQPRVVEYLKTPPTAAELRDALKRMGITAQQLLRSRGTPAEELGLTAPGTSAEAIIAAMVQHPILIERPVVLTQTQAALCRPADKVQALLAAR